MQHQADRQPKQFHSQAKRLIRIMLCFAWAYVLCHSLSLQPLQAQVPAVQDEGSAPNRPLRKGMDRYDLRAAEEAEQSEKLALVRKSFERERWDEGVQQLQTLFMEDRDSVVFDADGFWHPASTVALNLIRLFPPDAQRAYEAQYNSLAERDLKQAQKNHDLPRLIHISKRYLLTPFGQLASRELIEAAIDHGNTDAIVQQVRNLIRVDSPQLNDQDWRDQLIEILQKAGYTGLVTQLTERSGVAPHTTATRSSWMVNRFEKPRQQGPDWVTLAGSATGQAIPHTPETSLLPQWRHSLVSNPRIRQELNELPLKFEDQGALGLSVLSTVGTGEILITRTLFGLTAVNINTGKTLWKSRKWNTAPSVAVLSDQFDEEDDIPEEDNLLKYRILQRLTTSGSLGTLSADARHVYSLESLSKEGSSSEEEAQSSMEDSEIGGDDYLYARDVQTGRVVWRAGGPLVEEPPGLPAAGTFFFGPPTPDGDELFAVGERNGDILLFCLEVETGFVRWEQLLAAAGRRLGNDVARKSWTAPVAVRDSLIVCPTTTGWVTAVDRVSRTILWSVRMVPRALLESDSSESELAFDNVNREGGLDERWPPLQPILLRDRVLVAPIEFPDELGSTAPRLFCLDLVTGEQLWELPKEQFVGVIGASEDLAYLFDRFSVRAVSTSTGAVSWTCAIGDSVAGRPLLTQSRIMVPTQAGTLICVSLDKGAIIERVQVGEVPLRKQMIARLLNPEAPQQLSLGNLLSLGGRLISVTPLELTTFEWKADEVNWQAESPTHVESSIRWSQAQALRGQFADAILTLHGTAPLVQPNTPLSVRHRQSLLAILLLQLETELQGSVNTTTLKTDGLRSRLDEVQTLATSPEDREEVLRLGIDLALHSEDWNLAWSLIQQAIRQPYVFAVEQENRSVSPESWLADRLLKLAQIPDRTVCDEMRAAIRAEFQTRWTAAESDPASRERLRKQFAETPDGDRAELNSFLRTPDPLAITRLQALAKSRDQATAFHASLLLIERLAVPDWVGEARKRFLALPPDAACPADLRDEREALEKLLIGITDVHQTRITSWRGSKITVLRRLADSQQIDRELPLVWIGPTCEALENFSYRYDRTLQMVVIERADGSRYGELLLASNDENSLPQLPPVLYGCGLNIYLVHMGAIHAFSVPEKQLLWRRNTDHGTGYDPQSIPDNTSERGQLREPQTRIDSRSQLRQAPNLFEVANSRQLVIRTQRGIEVLDALTGQVRWSMPSCPPATVRCDEDQLIRLTDTQSQVYSIRSGRPLEAPDFSGFNERLSPLDPIGLTTLSELPGDGLTLQINGLRCRAAPLAGRTEEHRDRWNEQDLLQLDTVWTQPIATDSQLGAGPSGHGVWVEKTGLIQLIEWSTGRTQSLGTASVHHAQNPPPESPGMKFFVRWDRQLLYLSSNASSPPNIIDGPSMPVQGTLSVHSRTLSKPLWSITTQGFLLCHSLNISPCLPMLRFEDLPVAGFACQKVHLQLLDKETGEIIFEIHSPTFGMGASGCLYEPLNRRWSLLLAGERIQLHSREAPPP